MVAQLVGRERGAAEVDALPRRGEGQEALGRRARRERALPGAQRGEDGARDVQPRDGRARDPGRRQARPVEEDRVEDRGLADAGDEGAGKGHDDVHGVEEEGVPLELLEGHAADGGGREELGHEGARGGAEGRGELEGRGPEKVPQGLVPGVVEGETPGKHEVCHPPKGPQIDLRAVLVVVRGVDEDLGGHVVGRPKGGDEVAALLHKAKVAYFNKKLINNFMDMCGNVVCYF